MPRKIEIDLMITIKLIIKKHDKKINHKLAVRPKPFSPPPTPLLFWL